VAGCSPARYLCQLRKSCHLTATHHSSIYFELEHYHYDIFELKSEFLDQPKLICFLTDTKGNITSLTVQLEPTVKEILFTKKSESIGQKAEGRGQKER
jgi:Domain of unknown function (DUF3471)